jgi:hypothetical protein
VLHDVVLRLEPGDQLFLVSRFDFAETNEGPHFVKIVPDGFVEIEGEFGG